METAELRVTILECGGHVAEIVYKPAGETNPLWMQSRPTIDSDHFDKAVHGAIYGTDYEAKLISGLAGHNLCFPFWGTPTASEDAAGMTFHGESNIVRWEATGASSASLQVIATMPESATQFARSIRCAGQVIYFSETARNLSAWDRPVGWCEHVTFGAPFVTAGETEFAANLTRGFVTIDPKEPEVTWPDGIADGPHLLTGFRATDGPDLVNSFLVDQASEFGYVVAWNPRQRLLIGYVFKRSEFPWVNVWESRNADRHTRGMEFSNTPQEGTMKNYAKRQQIWDVPVYEWLDAKSELKKSYAAFVAAVPETYRGVAKLNITATKIEVEEKQTGDTIAIDWSPEQS